MRVYVSGPMTGMPDHNIPAFAAAARILRAQGYEVINPAELDEPDHTPGSWEWAAYLRRDIAQLVTCDGLALLKDWEHSRGARLEFHIALELGMTRGTVEHFANAQ